MKPQSSSSSIDVGVVVEPENPQKLAEAILNLASDPEQRRLLGESGRKLVTNEYDWARIVERWLSEIGIHCPVEGAVEAPGVRS